jgi:glyoxalase family protein
MLSQIRGLHHVTALARDATENNTFFTRTLGLRRVKKTVNFDAPDVYHLYYADEFGTPGSVMTYFPFPGIVHGRPGTGEVGTTAFSVPKGALPWWEERLAGQDGFERHEKFGEQRLFFRGPDGDGLSLVEVDGDERPIWPEGGIPAEVAIRGFHSVALRLQDFGATAELLKFMGYDESDRSGNIGRFAIPGGNGANFVDIETLPGTGPARQGAGSVHHVAFAVEDRNQQLEVRNALVDTGYEVTPVIDRDYFFSIYFRTPGGVLFEVATNEPGFARDEPVEHLGEELRLPKQHEHLRGQLEDHLQPIED